jgi:hypothetical protein
VETFEGPPAAGKSAEDEGIAELSIHATASEEVQLTLMGGEPE